MDITKFIKSHKELAELPFWVVFRTISVLMYMGLLQFTKEDLQNVDKL